jgi:hypothetical protein
VGLITDGDEAKEVFRLARDDAPAWVVTTSLLGRLARPVDDRREQQIYEDGETSPVVALQLTEESDGSWSNGDGPFWA